MATQVKIILIILGVLLLGGVGGIILERFVLPKLGILNPQAPIVVTRREEIRINEGINNVEIANRAKPALATIYVHEGKFGTEKLRIISSLTGVIMTSDGIILSSWLSPRSEQLTIVFADNTNLEAKIVATDNLTGLVFLQALGTRDLPIAKQGFSRELQVGEKILAVRAQEGGGITVKPLTLARRSLPQASLSKVYEFNRLNTMLETDLPIQNPGTALLNKDGFLVGISTQLGKEVFILRSEDLKLAMDRFFSQTTKDNKLVWPNLKLTYLILDEGGSRLLKLPKNYGILVKSSALPLQVGDFIFAADNKELSLEDSFQQILLAKKAGEKVKLKLIRNGQEREVELSL